MGCTHRYSKDNGIPFYRFPSDTERMWVGAMGRKDWVPNECTWICGKHFISGRNDPASQDEATLCIFPLHVKSPQKYRLMNNMTKYERTVGNEMEKS